MVALVVSVVSFGSSFSQEFTGFTGAYKRYIWFL